MFDHRYLNQFLPLSFKINKYVSQENKSSENSFFIFGENCAEGGFEWSWKKILLGPGNKSIAFGSEKD
jgi:hypothetical protein